MTPSAKQSNNDRIWDIATKAAIPLSILLVGAVIVNRISIREIQVTRFTDKDGAQLKDQILLERPPAWLKEDIIEIKGLLRDFDTRLRRVEIAVGVSKNGPPLIPPPNG